MAVVISQDLVLAPAPDPTPLANARIGYQSWVRGLPPSSVTASSTVDGLAPDAPTRPETWERWQPASMPAEWEVDFGRPRPADYVGIAAHTVGTQRATVVVEYSIRGTDWAEVAQTIPSDDSAILLLFSGVRAQYWRIRMTGGEGAPAIGVVYIGEALAMQRPIYGGHSPSVLSRQTTLNNSMSRGGQFLGQQIRRKGFETSADFKNLDPDWYRRHFDPFVESARRYPYFFSWRPSRYPDEVAYVWTAEDIQPSNSGTSDLMDVGWSMRGFDE